jgi:flagellin-like protein
MFEQLTDAEERGQVGIGTLIIFIAMVLVAAVAAGVLVNTSGLLQSQAQDTGADAQAQVSNQIDVVSATGIEADTDGNVETIELIVKKSPGSDPIDLSQASIQYTSDGASETLEYEATNGNLDGTNFVSTDVKDAGSTTNPSEVLDENGDRVKLRIDVDSIESGLGQGSEARLTIVDQSGASTVYGVNVPDVITGDYVSV